MKVIIIGIGRMGAGLSLKLLKKGHKVTVIDCNPEVLEALGDSFGGERIVGVGFDQEVLLRAQIDKVDAVVACTKSDEVNAVIARVAQNIYHVPRVIARLYDPRKADIYHRFGIQTISTTTWGINRASELLTYNQLDQVCDLGNGDVNLICIELPHLFVGRNINELTHVGEIMIVSVSRNNKTVIPTMGMILEAGDILHVAVAIPATDKCKAMFGL